MRWSVIIGRRSVRMNEADTCRKFVVPKLQAAGWDDRPHAINEQKSFTDGRVVFVGGKARRGKQKRSDYLLRYNQQLNNYIYFRAFLRLLINKFLLTLFYY